MTDRYIGKYYTGKIYGQIMYLADRLCASYDDRPAEEFARLLDKFEKFVKKHKNSEKK